MSPADPLIARGRRVLATEAQAVAALEDRLGEEFARACRIMLACEGRIVVTGMGKSGHVGRKIAATLASTGTPSLFVHPAEASHGDLGMVTPEDSVLALSNSGETPELADLIAYTRRVGIPLVAITSGGASTLAREADVALVLPPQPEASPVGHAPTTSTTMMLALGDAIAVALLRRTGFSAEQFREFHPGGQLGRRLSRVRDLMHGAAELPLALAGTAMTEALPAMTARRFGCLGVVDAAGALLGIVTDGDLRRHMGPDLLARTVAEVMTRNPKTIRPDALAGEALRLMNAHAITSLFVVEGGRPVGILHIHDCLRAGVA